MQNFSPLSQYLCAKCGSILKETNANIEISAITEECPNCGAFLANTLTKRNNRQVETALPKFQTAYDLTQFKIDIEKINKFMPLSNTGALAIIGSNANLLLTRLYVRALLPAKYGRLGSQNVVIIDAGNKSDFYQTVDFVKQYGLSLKSALDRIIVSRTFTIYQLRSLLVRELPKVAQTYQSAVVFVPGLLDLFDDPNIKKKEAKRIIERIMSLINQASSKILVVASFQDGKYSSLVKPSFNKRIALSIANNGRLAIDLYNEGKKASVTITQKELTIVQRK